MLDLGDQITLTYPSKPASPASVTVTIGLPDGTATAPVSATSGTYTYTTTQVGRHTVLWVATGPADSYADVFDVEAPTSALVSLADVKAHLNMTSARDDEELRLFIEAATALVEHFVGPVVPSTHVEVADADDVIVLSRAPVMSLTSIVPTFPFPDGNLPQLPTYVLNGPSGILRQQPYYFADWAFHTRYGVAGLRLTITYQTGRPSIPAAIRLAALIIIRHLWETQRLAGAKPAAGGEDQQQYGDVEIPSRAYELLAPYRRAPVIS